MTPRTDKELRELAFYIFENKVFGTWSFHSDAEMNNLMGMVFMPILFMPLDEREKLVEEVIHIYEFYDQAGPRSINGKPIFMSCRFITKEEWPKITKYVDELIKQRKEFMGEEVPEGEVNWHRPMGG
jgi:hypothetical protein